MKKYVVIVLFPILLATSTADARGIGDYLRDYPERITRTRLSRESILESREARRAARLVIRTKSRSRVIPQKSDVQPISPPTRLRQGRLSIIRMEERLRRRGVRKVYTKEEQQQHRVVRISARMESRRRADLGELLGILQWYVSEDDPRFSSILPTTSTEICKANAEDCTGLLDLSVILARQGVRILPIDPGAPIGGNGTGYFFRKTATKGIEFIAPNSSVEEGGMKIIWEP